jgi:hypothetical protein
MKALPMSRSIISLLFLLLCVTGTAQRLGKEKDTTQYKDRYGIRVGLDIVRPIYSFFDENDKGFELVGDYRLTKRFYLAAELGYRDHTRQEDFYNFTTKGQYIKAGVDYNAYKNWLGMENMIITGLRYGFSTFNTTLNESTINADPFLPERTETDPVDYDNLNASWAELVLGLKVEVLQNVFLGFSFRGNVKISSSEPENFRNLYVPGFERVYVNDYGFSFNYTISYLIPFYRK